MAQKLYVGNLPFTATENELRELFGQHGAVQSAQIVTDRDTGQPRGFAFVEMDNADAAITALDNQPFGGRNLKVNLAKPKTGGGGGGGGYGGGGGGGGGGGRQRRW
jgi:cold-inducible RNA-binding protein